MKTLKQHLQKHYGIGIEATKLTIPVIQNIVKEWLQEYRKNHQTISKEWETDEIDTYVILNNLIEEIEQ